MSGTRLRNRSEKDPESIDHYCALVGWDAAKLRTALYSTGLSDERIYLEDPNNALIDVLAEFLTVTGSSIFVTYAENGMGKSALKEFALRVFSDDKRFSTFSIDNPGPLTVFQLATAILHNINEDKKHPRSMGLVLERIEAQLIAAKRSGITSLIWIDEGQKLSIEKIGLLRSIADIKTPEGDLTCKILIVGTPDLRDKMDAWIKDYPEEAGAFDDRCGFYTMHLKKWTSKNIVDWWNLLSTYAAKTVLQATNPFDSKTALTILQVSEGKPRSIVQLTQMALNNRARACMNDKKAPVQVTERDIEMAIDKRLEGAHA